MLPTAFLTLLSLALPAQLSEEEQHEKLLTVQHYNVIADRFNRELAGRYPFGDLTTEDASTSTVCNFFSYYGDQLEPLRIRLDSLEDYDVNAARFIKELQVVNNFLSGTACSRYNQPIRIHFAPLDTTPRSSNPPRMWTLTDDFGRARSPHGIPFMDWRFGSPIALEVRWSEQTGLRPRRARPEDDFTSPDSASIRFGEGGKWALMRFIDSRRTTSPYWWPEYSPHKYHAKDDSLSIYLQFIASLVSIGAPQNSSTSNVQDLGARETRTELAIKLTFEASTAGKPRRYLVWPRQFPHLAPVIRIKEW